MRTVSWEFGKDVEEVKITIVYTCTPSCSSQNIPGKRQTARCHTN